MLSLMRKHAQSWLIKIALFAVAVVFVFWGVGSFRSERATRLATIDGKTITLNEYQQAYQQYLQRLQDSGGGRLDEKTIQEMKIKQRVLDSLLEKRILWRLGQDLGFTVTPEELTGKIQAIPAFQENGRFSATRYQRLLQANRISPEEFESEQSSEIMMERIRRFVNDFVKVDPEEVRDFFAYLSDELRLYLIRFQPEDYRGKIQPTADQLQDFFSRNQSRYQTPAQVRVSYLEVEPETQENPAAVSESDLQSYYQQHAGKFLDPQKNQPRPFEAVKEQIRGILARDRAREAARQKAEDLYDQLLLVGNLKTFGRQVQIPVQETAWLVQGQPGSGLEGNRTFLDKAFSLKAGEISTVQDLGPDRGFFILQSAEKRESRPLAFDQAEPRVRQDWLTEQASITARSEAESFLKAVRAGKDWRRLAGEKNLAVEETPFFSRFKDLPAWAQTPENQEVIFSVGSGHPYPDKVVTIGPGYGFIAFQEYRAAPSEAFQQQKERLAMILRQQKGSRLWEDWLGQMRQKAKIKVYQELN